MPIRDCNKPGLSIEAGVLGRNNVQPGWQSYGVGAIESGLYGLNRGAISVYRDFAPRQGNEFAIHVVSDDPPGQKTCRAYARGHHKQGYDIH